MTLRLLLLIAPFLFILPRASADNPAEQRLRQAVDQSIEIAERAPSNAVLLQKIRPVLDQNVSFSAMTRRAIGPGWRQFSPEQQKEAIKLFTELIVRRYVGRFTIGEHPSVIYKPATTPSPGRVEIPTSLLYKGSRYEVIYRLEQAEGWKITDIVVEGVSFIGNYRSQFDAQFQKGGPAAVLASLNNAVQNPK